MTKTKELVILLDLNYTLVGNSHLKRYQKMPYIDKIPSEKYRGWLVDLVREHTVLLCTVRHQDFEDVTLATIAEKLDGWQPDRAYFNATDSWKGAPVKKAYLETLIFPAFGKPEETRYYAVESLGAARAMYADYKIPADKVPTDETWDELPYDKNLTFIDRWRQS